MSRKQRIEITIETAQVLLIRCRTLPGWCQQCAATVARLTVEDAAVAARVSLPTINQWADTGLLHSFEAEQGPRYICLNSLLNSILANTKGETL
jgi:hypothetical protein